ncbi:MAG: 2-phosphosulfolactate phosphatase [Verrucomicrobiales bacterium]
MIKALWDLEAIEECSDLAGSQVVVFDVLRATSSMITAMQAGAERIRPVRTVEEARAWKSEFPDWLLAGERGGEPLPGFDLGNSPSDFSPERVQGASIVWTTTNGSRALVAAGSADKVWLGGLVNVAALAQVLQVEQPRCLWLFCAGTGNKVAWEDVLGAGALVRALSKTPMNWRAKTARLLYTWQKDRLASFMASTRNGRALMSSGRESDVALCAELNGSNVVPELRQGEVVAGPVYPSG